MEIQRSILYGVSERSHSLPRVGSRAVDAEVERLKQAGLTFLPLKPYPDRPLPPHIVEAAIRMVRNAHNAPSRGLPELVQAIAQRLATELSITIDPDKEVLVTGGGMHALFVSFGAVMGPGDQAIVPAPCYFLQGIADLLGFELVYVPMSEEQGYRWDYDRLASAITPRTRAIFVNTPVNPTGVVLDANDLRAISSLAEQNGIWIIADESYDRMVYDGRTHLSLLAEPKDRSHTILIRSCTKSYAMPAWRVGFAVAPATVVEDMTRILEWQCLYGSAVSQAAAAAAISGPQDWLAGVDVEFQANRDSILEAVRAARGVTCVVPQGGPFVWLNVSGLGVDDDIMAQHLLHHSGIAVTPGSAFQSSFHVRMPIGGTREVVAEAGGRLRQAVRDLSTTPQR